MRILLDTVDVEIIKSYYDIGIIYGVTTKPTLAKKFGASKVAAFFGDTKAEDRQDIVEKFQNTLLDVQVSGSPNSTYYLSFPIHGLDRVGFVCSDTKDVILYVAGSTF